MRTAALAFCLFASVLPAAAGAEDPGAIDGALRIDDQPTELSNVYVVEIKVLPERQIDVAPARYLSVLMTDRPFPDGQRPSDIAAHQLSFAGELRGIGLDIDPATGEVMSGRTFLPAEERPQYFTVMTIDVEPMIVLQDWAETNGRLQGHVRTPRPLEVVNFDGSPGGPATFAVEATFDAPILPAPVLAETLEGPDAQASPQAAVVRQFITGVTSGDAAAVQAVLTPDHPMQEMLTPEGMEEVRAMMIGPSQDPEAFLAQLTKVYVFEGGSAIAVFQSPDGGSSTFPLKQEGGAWLMGMP